MINQSLRKLFLWGWNSPTSTAWAGQGAQMLRVLLLTPLLITSFSLYEIASWYLFASTTFLGSILCQRSKMTFSRMVSMASEGARELSPIKSGKKVLQIESEAETTEIIQRLYSTFSSIFLFVALLSLLISSLTGFFALQKLNHEVADVSRVWYAFVVFLFGNFLVNANSKYDSLLQGLGHISLVNRINVAGALLSVFLGSVSLYFGADIFILACIIQLVSVVNILLFRYFSSIQLRDLGIRGVGFKIDKQCVSWAKEPLIKGFVSQLCVDGVLQFSAILIPFYYNATIVATYLFSLRIFQMIVSFSMAPTFAYQPVFAKLLAAGEVTKLRNDVVRKSRISLIVFILASVVAGVGISFGIEFLDTDLVFMPIEIWLLLTGLALLDRFNTLCRMVCSVGNHIILVKQYVIIGIMSLALLVLTGKEHMMVFIVLSLWGPPALIPIFSALKHASRLLQVKRNYLLLLVLFPSILVLFLFVVLYMYAL